MGIKTLLDKGDYPGHPFRGNQYTGGISGADSFESKIRYGRKMKGRVSANVLKAMAKDGGFTFNPKRGEIRHQGNAISPYKENEKSVSLKSFKKNGARQIKEFVRQNAGLLALPNHHLGAWKEGNKIYLDVSVVVPSHSEAGNIGRASDQLAFFDLGTMTNWSRHRSPTTGEYRYLPDDQPDADIDAIGKALERGVMLVPADTIDDTSIPLIVAKLIGMSAISKGDYPGHPFRGNQYVKVASGLGMMYTTARDLNRQGMQRGTDNPEKATSAQQKKDLTRVNKRATDKELKELRSKVIKNLNNIKHSHKKEVMQKYYCYMKQELRKPNSKMRSGGELGRSNAKDRRKRKQAMFKEFSIGGRNQICGCTYCGVIMDYKRTEVEKLDHMAGYASKGNLAPACRGCNSAWSDQPLKTKLGGGKTGATNLGDLKYAGVPVPSAAKCKGWGYNGKGKSPL